MVTTVTDNSPQSINTSLFSLDKQVQEIKKLTDTFNDKISGINPKANVISVNGKQGIVTLGAQDVHALPDTTVIPTTTGELVNNSDFITSADVAASYVPQTRKVNNKELDTDITLTASDVGALPDTTVIPPAMDVVLNHDCVLNSGFSVTEYFRYSKYGRIVIIDIGGVICNVGSTTLLTSDLPVFRTRLVGDIFADVNDNSKRRIYANINSSNLMIHASPGGPFYGTYVYLTD